MLNFLKPMVEPVISKVCDMIPKPQDRIKAKEEFEKNLISAVFEADLAQNRINEAEAKHKSMFVAGWRPFIGWVCGIGLMWSFLVRPIFNWIISIAGLDITGLPALDMGAIMQLVTAMLGMGALRTYEKMKGVASK